MYRADDIPLGTPEVNAMPPRFFCVGLALSMATGAWAQMPALVVGEKHDDRQLGLVMPLFTGSVAIPPRRLVGDEPRELWWYESQLLRGWVVQLPGADPTARLRIVVGEMCHAPAGAPSGGGSGSGASGWSTATRRAWIEAFAEMPQQGEAFEQAIGGGRSCAAVRLRSQDRQGLGLVLSSGARELFVLFKAPAAWDAVALEARLVEVASKIALTTPGVAPAVKELRLREVAQGAASPERSATIGRVQAELAGATGWWYLSGAHHVVVSNIDAVAARERIVALLTSLERVHDAFRRLHPPRQEIRAVSRVKIFAHRDQLFAHFSEHPPTAINRGLMGMWIPAYDELALADDPASADPKGVLVTLFHEGFHQYIHFALGAGDLPRWFDEGTADFFGGAVVEGKAVRVLENPSRKNVITGIASGEFKEQYKWDHPSLAQLVAMDRDAFYREVKWQVFLYAMSWSLVYYLHREVEEGSPYHGLLQRYVEALATTRSAKAAVDATFGKVDMDALERDWKAFWSSPERRQKAEARPFLAAPPKLPKR